MCSVSLLYHARTVYTPSSTHPLPHTLFHTLFHTPFVSACIQPTQRLGPSFAATLRAKERDNDKFAFLRPGNKHHDYFVYRVGASLGEELAHAVTGEIEGGETEGGKIEGEAEVDTRGGGDEVAQARVDTQGGDDSMADKDTQGDTDAALVGKTADVASTHNAADSALLQDATDAAPSKSRKRPFSEQEEGGDGGGDHTSPPAALTDERKQAIREKYATYNGGKCSMLLCGEMQEGQ